MLGSSYDTQNCSVARALEVVGERWSLLVLRDAIRGTRRFEDFLSGLGIARNVLTARLNRFCEQGVLKRVQYQDRPPRHEYHVTQKGIDLRPVLIGLMEWGDRYSPSPNGPPTILTHADCGHDLHPVLTCGHCGETVDNAAVGIRPGPGA